MAQPAEKILDELAKHNEAQWINRLPVEILSRVFVIGDTLDQITALEESAEEKRQEFQEIVAQVCRHWRAIVVSMPMLWTYIRIDASYPHSRAQIFLDRSGNTIPLEIELDMTGEFMKELAPYDNQSHGARTTETLKFIVSKGGNTSRWASLKVWGEVPGVLIATIEFIAGSSLDNLHTLALVNDPDDPSMFDELTSRIMLGRERFDPLPFRHLLPLLRNVQLYGIAGDFLFTNPAAPFVNNLSHLELSTVPALPPIEGLYELLSRNLGLESLILDMGLVSDLYIELRSPLKQVLLKHLRHFTLKEPMNTTWALSVLMMIDAPGLEEFTFHLEDTVQPQLPGIVTTFASIGRGSDGHLVSRRPANESEEKDLGPIYPALQRLTIGPFSDGGVYIRDMLRSFSTITRLDWELRDSADSAIMELAELPLPCPRLEHIRAHGVPFSELVKVVRLRKEKGKPLKILEIHRHDWERLDDGAKEYLSKTLETFGTYVGDDPDFDSGSETYSGESETESEEDEWTDTDESNGNSGGDSDELQEGSDEENNGESDEEGNQETPMLNSLD